MSAMQIQTSGPLLIPTPVHSQGLLGLLAWTVALAFIVTAAYYTAKSRLLRKSPTAASDRGQGQDPSQVKVFGLFFLIAVVVFALLLATHFVPGT